MRTALVCQRAKDAGTRVHSILLQEVSGRAKKLMKDCATDASLYFESLSAADRNKVFVAIAQDLSNLRLSK